MKIACLKAPGKRNESFDINIIGDLPTKINIDDVPF